MGDGSSFEQPLVLPDVTAWRAWLDLNESTSDGVWLMMARKGKDSDTSLMVGDALEEALCSGWIDGQRRSFDDRNFVQRFTPRRKRSLWSVRNVGIVERLIAEGRMRPRGFEEIEKAQADGRWDAAYEGPAKAEPPQLFVEALERSPRAKERFEGLGRTDRYSVLHPLLTARTEATLLRRIEKAISTLESAGD